MEWWEIYIPRRLRWGEGKSREESTRSPPIPEPVPHILWIERSRQPQTSSSWSHRLRLRLCSTASSSTRPLFLGHCFLDWIGLDPRPPVSSRRDGRNGRDRRRRRHPPAVHRRVCARCRGSWPVAASCPGGARYAEVRGLAIGQDSVFPFPFWVHEVASLCLVFPFSVVMVGCFKGASCVAQNILRSVGIVVGSWIC